MDRDKVLDVAGALATISMTAIGLAIGGTLGNTILAGLGLNVGGSLIVEHASRLKGRWLAPPDGVLNTDLQHLLAKAFVRAVERVEAQYLALPDVSVLDQNDKATIRGLFDGIKSHSERLFAAPLQTSTEDAFAHRAAGDVRRDMAARLLRYLEALQWPGLRVEHLRDFLLQHFSDHLTDAFRKELLAAGVDVAALHAAPHDQPRKRFFDHLIETHTHLFAGRDAQIEAILDIIRHQPSGYVYVEGLSGYGKTSLMAKLVQQHPEFAYHFISQAYKTSDVDPTAMESLLFNLCEQLGLREPVTETLFGARAAIQRSLRSSPNDSARRVIMIDAIDEVDRHPNALLGLFPEVLAPGVFVILSARTLGDLDYLSQIGLHRRNVARIIKLPGLGDEAIASLLAAAGGQASALARSDAFVAKLLSVSAGDPFYLRFLVEDVAGGAIRFDNVKAVPSGLHAYLDRQFEILDRSATRSQHRDILGLILEAKGPLSKADLIAMVDGLDFLNFSNILRDIQRFLLAYGDHYMFCHPRFKDYFQSLA